MAEIINEDAAIDKDAAGQADVNDTPEPSEGDGGSTGELGDKQGAGRENARIRDLVDRSKKLEAQLKESEAKIDEYGSNYANLMQLHQQKAAFADNWENLVNAVGGDQSKLFRFVSEVTSIGEKQEFQNEYDKKLYEIEQERKQEQLKSAAREKKTATDLNNLILSNNIDYALRAVELTDEDEISDCIDHMRAQLSKGKDPNAWKDREVIKKFALDFKKKAARYEKRGEENWKKKALDEEQKKQQSANPTLNVSGSPSRGKGFNLEDFKLGKGEDMTSESAQKKIARLFNDDPALEQWAKEFGN